MNEKKYKYFCENCDFHCREISKWNQHIETEKHKTGKRADYKGKYKCEKCNYETINIIAYKQHKLNKHSTKEEKEKEYPHFCKLCNFGTFSEKTIENHNKSIKHKYKEITKNNE